MVDISFAEAELTPPKRFGSKAQPVHAWAVYIIEPKPDESVGFPIEWLLITTVPTKSFKDARQRVESYAKHWGIEVYHRTLKSGCKIKGRQLGDADRIETCPAIGMVVAWRIFHLTMLGRENPEAACTIFFPRRRMAGSMLLYLKESSTSSGTANIEGSDSDGWCYGPSSRHKTRWPPRH